MPTLGRFMDAIRFFLLMLLFILLIPAVHAGQSDCLPEPPSSYGLTNTTPAISDTSWKQIAILPTLQAFVSDPPQQDSPQIAHETITSAPAEMETVTTVTKKIPSELIPAIANSYNETSPGPSHSSSLIRKKSPAIINTTITPDNPGSASEQNSSNVSLKAGNAYAPDRLIVRFKSQDSEGLSISEHKIRSAHEKIGAKIKKDFSREGLPGLQVVQLKTGTDVQTAIREYQSNPDVLYAEPDYIISLSPDQAVPAIQTGSPLQILSIIPDDPFFSSLWGLRNTGQKEGTPGADINATNAWDLSTGSNRVIVAVVDTGVLYTHSDLSANIWTNPGEIPDNGIDDDLNGYTDDIHGWNFINDISDPLDDNGHGTHVSGIIGAEGNNGIGVTGVNWQVNIMALKFLDASGSGSTSDAIPAILYANANGASVISNSWNGPGNGTALKDAINASPAVVVCAAGNIDQYNPVPNNDVAPQYPASYPSANIISVAATDNTDQLASFSHYGLISVDLAAPGTDIYSTYVDGNYVSISGTSMATPHVSGVAALVKSLNQSLTAVQIKQIIISTVDVKSSLSGLVNTSGRLNAYRALTATPPANMTTGIGVVRNNNTWILDASGNGAFGPGDFQYAYGRAGDVYVSGDWTWTGITSIGVIRDSNTWLLDASGNGAYGAGDRVYTFGKAGDVYVTGNWNTDGKTEIGVVRNNNTWLLDASGNGVYGAGDRVYTFGKAGDMFVTGDWNADGKTEIGVVRNNNTWLLDASGNGAYGAGDLAYTFGKSGDVYVTGDWNNDGKTEIGVVRNSTTWLLDASGNGVYGAGDNAYSFGKAGDIPITGKWN